MERGLTSLLESCRSLSTLDVSDNYHLTGTPSFSKLPHTLRSLNICGCLQLQPPVIDFLLETCASELRELYMDQVDMAASIADLNRLLAQMGKLEVLQYRYKFHPLPQPKVTGDPQAAAQLLGLGELARLKSLVMSDNSNVSDAVSYYSPLQAPHTL